MIALDASILAPALNRWAPDHARAASVVETLANGERPWALPWPALHGLIALITHRYGVARPLPLVEAMAFVDQLLESPSVSVLGPGPRHARALAGLLAEETTRRFDARLVLAAVLREHGVRELLSADPQIRRFRFLSVVNPLGTEPWSPEQPPARRYRRLASS